MAHVENYIYLESPGTWLSGELTSKVMVSDGKVQGANEGASLNAK